MTLDQIFRQQFDHLRSRLSRAEKPDAARQPSRLRMRIKRYLRVAGGFVAALIVFGFIAMFMMEAASRPKLDLASPPSPPNGSRAIAAAAYLSALPAPEKTGLDGDRLFAPPQLRMRENLIFEAADKVARAYVDRLPLRRGGRDPLLAAARAAGHDARAAALLRLNGAVARQQVVIDRSPQAFRMLARRAAAACAARAAMLADLSAADKLRESTAERAFFAARGEAYAWYLLLNGAAADSDDPRLADNPDFARAEMMLARAAARRPILFLRSVRGGALSRSEITEIGLDLAIAAQAARALAGD